MVWLTLFHVTWFCPTTKNCWKLLPWNVAVLKTVSTELVFPRHTSAFSVGWITSSLGTVELWWYCANITCMALFSNNHNTTLRYFLMFLFCILFCHLLYCLLFYHLVLLCRIVGYMFVCDWSSLASSHRVQLLLFFISITNVFFLALQDTKMSIKLCIVFDLVINNVLHCCCLHCLWHHVFDVCNVLCNTVNSHKIIALRIMMCETLCTGDI